MHRKEIKKIVKEQLKEKYPHWRNIPRKEKKSIAKKVLDEVVREYDFEQTIQTPIEELLGIEEQVPTDSIKTIEEMGRFIKRHYSSNLLN